MTGNISQFLTMVLLPPFLGVSLYFMYSMLVNYAVNMFSGNKVIYFKEVLSEIILLFTAALGLTFIKTLYIFKRLPEDNPEVLDQLQIMLFPPLVTYLGYTLLFTIPILNIFLLIKKKSVNKLVKGAYIITLAYFFSRFGIIYY
jgi:hypothetical protein